MHTVTERPRFQNSQIHLQTCFGLAAGTFSVRGLHVQRMKKADRCGNSEFEPVSRSNGKIPRVKTNTTETELPWKVKGPVRFRSPAC